MSGYKGNCFSCFLEGIAYIIRARLSGFLLEKYGVVRKNIQYLIVLKNGGQ